MDLTHHDQGYPANREGPYPRVEDPTQGDTTRIDRTDRERPGPRVEDTRQDDRAGGGSHRERTGPDISNPIESYRASRDHSNRKRADPRVEDPTEVDVARVGGSHRERTDSNVGNPIEGDSGVERPDREGPYSYIRHSPKVHVAGIDRTRGERP